LKKLYRSRTDRKIAGVCGGFAECFGIDPSIVRLGLVVISVVSVWLREVFRLERLVASFDFIIETMKRIISIRNK
jgi:phage shock protein PspC (stress-responsive transcriptional regulator)